MPAHPTFLSRILRLQIRDRHLCRCGAVASGAFRRAWDCRGLFEVLAFRWLQISARDSKSRRRGHDNIRACREYPEVVRTSPRRIRRVVSVNNGAAVSSPPSLESKPTTAFL